MVRQSANFAQVFVSSDVLGHVVLIKESIIYHVGVDDVELTVLNQNVVFFQILT